MSDQHESRGSIEYSNEGGSNSMKGKDSDIVDVDMLDPPNIEESSPVSEDNSDTDSFPMSLAAFRLMSSKSAKEGDSGPVSSVALEGLASPSDVDMTNEHNIASESVLSNDAEASSASGTDDTDEIDEGGPSGNGIEEIVQNRPLKLDNLPKEILRNILGHIFPVGRSVMPWWSCGTLLLFGRGYCVYDEKVSFKDNLDTAFLQVNKACYHAGTDILYGSNHFRFEQAPCSLWWFRRIGEHNVLKIKMLTFIMNSGWYHDRRDPYIIADPSETCFERDWSFSLGIVLRSRVKLEFLSITTLLWTDMRNEPDYEDDDRDELNMFRKQIADKLGKFRDVKLAEIVQVGEQWIGSSAPSLQLLMQQPGRTRAEEPPVPRMTVKQLVAHCKAKKEEFWRLVDEKNRETAEILRAFRDESSESEEL